MRPLATGLALSLTLTAAGCCYGGTGACVVESAWGTARCEPSLEAVWCIWDDPAAPPPPDLSSCGGSFHEGDDCADLGFTVRCGGGYWVRAADGC